MGKNFERETEQLELIKSWHFISPRMKMKYLEEIKQIEAAIAEQELRITVFGEFSSGKSTFLNALVGKDLLPHEMAETTATITYIHNVPKDDKRLCSIIVEFADGRESLKLNLDDSQQLLKDYLTTKSKLMDVVTTVRCVHIYCHMFESTHRLVLVDTPGLNGMKEYHRDITIDELRRSHISICMFDQKGLTVSEIPNLQELLKYQQEFIFVINFLDRLNYDEGDSAETQLDILRQQLSKNVPEIEVREDNIFVISALYALVGRDKNIRRLYHGDTTDVTDANREKLLIESRISVLEEYLKNLSQEKFFSYLEDSLHYKLVQLVKRIEQETNYYKAQIVLVNSNGQEKRKLIQAEIDKRKNLFESRKKDLQNFITQKWISILEALKKKLDKEQTSWLNEPLRQIDTLNIEDIKAVQRIVQHVNNLANAHHSKYRQLVKDFLTAIYQDGILKVDAYYPKIREITEQQVTFELGQQTNEDYGYVDLIAKYEERIENSRRRLAKAEEAQEKFDKQLKDDRNQLKKAEEERKKLQLYRDQSLCSLGERPDIEKKEIEKKRDVPRTFWGFEIPFTSKTETYMEEKDDTSRRDEWDNRRQRILFNSRKKIDEVDRKIFELRRRIKNAEENDNDHEHMVNDFKQQLEDAKSDKKRRIDEINEFKKNAQQEFFRAERKRLKKSLQDYQEKHFTAMIEELDKNFKANKPKILELVAKHYTLVYRRENQRLKNLLNGESEMAEESVEINDISILQQEINTWKSDNKE